MTRTGSVVTLEVAKQGAIYHGLATLLNQPSPMMPRGEWSVCVVLSSVCWNATFHSFSSGQTRCRTTLKGHKFPQSERFTADGEHLL